jgi:hypothetical protein
MVTWYALMYTVNSVTSLTAIVFLPPSEVPPQTNEACTQSSSSFVLVLGLADEDDDEYDFRT